MSHLLGDPIFKSLGYFRSYDDLANKQYLRSSCPCDFFKSKQKFLVLVRESAYPIYGVEQISAFNMESSTSLTTRGGGGDNGA